MAKPKRKLTAAEKQAKKELKKQYTWIFIHGKQVRVKRPQTIKGLPADEFIAKNEDPIWLHQNEMWELIEPHPDLNEIQDHSTSDSDFGFHQSYH